MGSALWTGSILTLTAATLVYLNTLPAGFAFDDNFAVIYNGDVTNNDNPLLGLLKNDFWGQRISSNMSHKSYRPLTILVFRCVRLMWDVVPPSMKAPFKAWRSQVDAGWEGQSEKDGKPRNRSLDPLLFHAANIVAHALASLLVCRLAYFMFRMRARLAAECAAAGFTDAGRGGSKGLPVPPSQQQQQQQKTPTKRKIPVVEENDGSSQPPLQRRLGGLGEGLGLKQRKKGPPGGAKDKGSAESGAQPGGAKDSATPGVRAGNASLGQRQGEGTLAEDCQRAILGLVVEGCADVAAYDSWSQVHLPAWLTALSFALHPVHTEAVAGIVGHAELLCVCFSIPALLLYFHAADSDTQSPPPLPSPSPANSATATNPVLQSAHQSMPDGAQQQRLARQAGTQLSPRALLLLHWLRVCAAFSLAWMAALSKEIGITVIGAMLAYDVLLVPMQRVLAKQGTGSELLPGWRRRKWIRMLVIAVGGVMYVKVRSWVAVDQLVRIYRKVENPIPFSPSAVTRVATTGYLHALYARTLVWPVNLSADWSFACVPVVDDLCDHRNWATALLYAYMLVVAVAAVPWGVLRDWAASGAAPLPSPSTAIRRWRLVVLAGLMVGPFFPASNVLFYVGTFIGERLMYFPSIGFCMLVAECLVAVPLTAVAAGQVAKGTHKKGSYDINNYDDDSVDDDNDDDVDDKVDCVGGRKISCGGGGGEGVSSVLRALVQLLVLLSSASMLGLYAARTYERNWDWMSEETLFTSALEVCPNSAKVQLNSGILQRRKENMSAAIVHFERARELDPGYCEPTYWIGVSLFNQGFLAGGVEELENALSCKYVAAEAVKALNNIFQALHANNPKDGLALQRWGQVLVRPEVGRMEEGCETLESAALTYAVEGRNAPGSTMCLDACLNALKGATQPKGMSVHVVVAVLPRGTNELSLKQIHECITARRAVYIAIGNYGQRARITRKAMYTYLLFIQKTPQCRREVSKESFDSKHTSHMRLVHSVQSQDPDDPWLQMEWGEILSGLGRSSEAAMHLSVAGTMLGMHAKHATGLVAEGEKRPPIMSLTADEQSATEFDAYHHAAVAYERAVDMKPTNMCDLILYAADSYLKALALAPNKKLRELVQQQASKALSRASMLGNCRNRAEFLKLLQTLTDNLSAFTSGRP